MTKKQKANELIVRLAQLYPDAKCSLDFENELELIVATCLSAQCTDERVNIVTKDLFARYHSAQDYADADIKELEEIIRSCGFYKNKAKNLKGLGEVLCQRFHGNVPSTMDELLQLPGVGRKTANLVLGVVYNDQGIVADTHCIRLSNRFGLTDSTDPVAVEKQLSRLISKNERLMFCHRLIYHGRAVCQARRPSCDVCTLSDLCSVVKREKRV